VRELRGACVQHTMWLCVKIGGEDKRGETAGKCRFEHFQAWIPACSRTAALLHQWRGIGAAGRGTRFKPLLKKKVGRLPLIFVQSSFRGSHEAESGLSGV